MVDRQPRTRDVIVRMLAGGTLVVLSLPILAPLIVGAIVTWPIYGVYRWRRSHGSDEKRHLL